MFGGRPCAIFTDFKETNSRQPFQFQAVPQHSNANIDDQSVPMDIEVMMPCHICRRTNYTLSEEIEHSVNQYATFYFCSQRCFTFYRQRLSSTSSKS